MSRTSNASGMDPIVQGLAAYLLGICFEFNDDSVPGLTRTTIQSIVINRLGADQYVSRLNRLKESKYFVKNGLEVRLMALVDGEMTA